MIYYADDMGEYAMFITKSRTQEMNYTKLV